MARSVLVRSALIFSLMLVVVASAQALDSAGAHGSARSSGSASVWFLRGGVYRGTPPDMSQPLSGVNVRLHGSTFRWDLGTLLDTAYTLPDGTYELRHLGSLYNYLHIVQIDQAGYISTGATAGDGCLAVDAEHIRCDALSPGIYESNRFWDWPWEQPTTTPTPTATRTSTPPAWRFKGHVFSGMPPDATSPLSGVTVQLWGSGRPADQGSLLDTDQTDATTGTFALAHVGKAYSYFHVVELNPSGYASTGAQASPGGVVVDYDRIRFDIPKAGLYEFSNFWDSPRSTHTPTPTSAAATATPTATGAMTASATPTRDAGTATATPTRHAGTATETATPTDDPGTGTPTASPTATGVASGTPTLTATHPAAAIHVVDLPLIVSE